MTAAHPLEGHRAELVQPLTPPSDDETSLTIAQAAKLAGVSPATLHRRIVDGELPADRPDGRTWRLSRKTVLEVGPLRKRDAPRSKAEHARDVGLLVTKCFPLFREYVPLEDIAERLAIDPDMVAMLHQKYLDLCRRSAEWLATAPAPAPRFNHEPAPDGTCCAGHLAAHQMMNEAAR
jgi:excisionase family DNA binding protein